MEMEYEGKGSTKLALISKGDGADVYIQVSNFEWSAEPGKAYEISYSFGDYFFRIPSIGTKSGIYNGFITITSDDFLKEFAKADKLTLRLDDTLIDNLSLDGSAAALRELDRCRGIISKAAAQAKADEERLKFIPKDPFADTQP